MDGTVVKAWASMKSFQPKDNEAPDRDDGPGDPPDDGASPASSPDQSSTKPEPMTRPTRRSRNAEVFGHSLGPMAFASSLRGERRSNATHASMTDPEARLFKKSPGTAAALCFMGHSLMDMRRVSPPVRDTRRLRSGLIVQADRHSPGSTRRLTLAADRGYDTADFVAELRQMVVTPHVAQKSRHSAIDGRTTRHPGYAKSQRRRKKIEEPFGWAKTVGGRAQAMYHGIERVRARFTLTIIACNLARLPKLLAA